MSIAKTKDHPEDMLTGAIIRRIPGHQPDVLKNKEQIKADFLVAYSQTGNVLLAVNKVGICRQTLYKWRREDPEFAEAMNYSHEDARDAVEAKLRHAAMHDGNITAMIFYLKGNWPEKYSERHDYFVSQRFRGRTTEELRELAVQHVSELHPSGAGGVSLSGELQEDGED